MFPWNFYYTDRCLRWLKTILHYRDSMQYWRKFLDFKNNKCDRNSRKYSYACWHNLQTYYARCTKHFEISLALQRHSQLRLYRWIFKLLKLICFENAIYYYQSIYVIRALYIIIYFSIYCNNVLFIYKMIWLIRFPLLSSVEATFQFTSFQKDIIRYRLLAL